MKRFLWILLSVHFSIVSLRAEDSIAFPSPDGQFAVRTTSGPNRSFRDLIEVKTKRALKKLEGPFRGDVDPVLWSADSRWVAYANDGGRVADTFVPFWDGTSFSEVTLPRLLTLGIKFRPTRRAGDTRCRRSMNTPPRHLVAGCPPVRSWWSQRMRSTGSRAANGMSQLLPPRGGHRRL